MSQRQYERASRSRFGASQSSSTSSRGMVTSASWTEATAPVSETRSDSSERIRRTWARASRRLRSASTA